MENAMSAMSEYMPYLVVLSFIILGFYIWLVINGFKRSPVWGLVVLSPIIMFILTMFGAAAGVSSAVLMLALFLPTILIIMFGIVDWKKSKIPFIGYIIASVIFGIIINKASTSVADSMKDGGTAELQDMQTYAEEIDRRVKSGAMSEAQGVEEKKKLLIATFTGKEYKPSFEMEKEKSLSDSGIERGKSELDDVDVDAKIKEAIEQEKKARPVKKKTKPRVRVYQRIKIDEAEKYIGGSMKITSRTGAVRKGNLIEVKNDTLYFENRVSGGNWAFSIAKPEISKLELQTWVSR